MPRYYTPIKPSANKAAAPVTETKAPPKHPPKNRKDPKEKDETGGQ